MMLKRVAPWLALLLLVGTAADAQPGPGHGGGGGGGGRHGGGRPPSGDGATNAALPPEAQPPKPMDRTQIVGVVQALDPATRKVTISYDAVEELGWPRGTMDFYAYKAEVLAGVTVGEKVRFRLDAQRIVEIRPY